MADGNQSNTISAGSSRIAAVPHIINELMAMKSAQASGDPLAIKTARQNYEAEVQKMRAKLFERDANKWSAQAFKLNQQVNEANAKIAALTHGTEVAKQREKSRSELAVKKQEGANTLALDAQDYDQEINQFHFEIAATIEGLRGLNLGYTDEDLREIVDMAVTKKYGDLTKPDDVVMLETLNELREKGKMSEEKYRWAWETYKGTKARSGTSSGGTGEGGTKKTNVVNTRNAIDSVLNGLLRDTPLKMTRQDPGWWNPDNTEGRFPTDPELEDIADKAISAVAGLAQLGVEPWQVQKRLMHQKQNQFAHASGTGGFAQQPKRGTVIKFHPSDPDSAQWTGIIENRKMGQRYVEFYLSPAGQRFEEWLQASVDAGQFIDPMSMGEPPQPGAGGDGTTPKTEPGADGETAPKTPAKDLTPDDPEWTATSPGEEPPDHKKTMSGAMWSPDEQPGAETPDEQPAQRDRDGTVRADELTDAERQKILGGGDDSGGKTALQKIRNQGLVEEGYTRDAGLVYSGPTIEPTEPAKMLGGLMQQPGRIGRKKGDKFAILHVVKGGQGQIQGYRLTRIFKSGAGPSDEEVSSFFVPISEIHHYTPIEGYHHKKNRQGYDSGARVPNIPGL